MCLANESYKLKGIIQEILRKDRNAKRLKEMQRKNAESHKLNEIQSANAELHKEIREKENKWLHIGSFVPLFTNA